MRHYTALLRPYRWWVLAALSLGILTVLANLGLMSTSAYLIARAAQHPYTILLLWVPIVGVRFFGTSRGVFRYLERYVSHDVTFQLLKELRVFVYRRIEPIVPAGLQPFHSGDLLSRLVGDVDVMQNLYLGLFSPPVVALGTSVIVVGFMSYFGQSLAIALAVFIVAAGVVVPALTQWGARGLTGRMVESRGQLSRELVETIHGNTDLLVMGQEARHLHKLTGLVQQWSRRQMRLHWISGISAGVMQALNNGAMWVVLVLGIGLVVRHTLAPVLLPVVVLLTMASFEAVNALPPAFQMRGQIDKAKARIDELVDQPAPAASGTRTAAQVLAQADQVAPTVSLDHVGFRYQPGSDPVLDGVSFTIGGGQHLAVVGPSGAGKSTLSGILAQLWPYQQGSITVNGVELRAIAPQAMPQLVAVVDQEPHLFDTSLKENLLLANPCATEEDVHEALRIAQLEDMVQQLPEGLDTAVGDHGVNLSGGERKRLAVARAILQNAPIMVFDEATEGLDALTERALIQDLGRWASQRTVLWVTHRLANLDMMDGVVVLDGGHVVQDGKALQLLGEDGLFRQMREAEAQSFDWPDAVQVG